MSLAKCIIGVGGLLLLAGCGLKRVSKAGIFAFKDRSFGGGK
jgi:hypothetical protein